MFYQRPMYGAVGAQRIMQRTPTFSGVDTWALATWRGKGDIQEGGRAKEQRHVGRIQVVWGLWVVLWGRMWGGMAWGEVSLERWMETEWRRADYVMIRIRLDILLMWSNKEPHNSLWGDVLILHHTGGNQSSEKLNEIIQSHIITEGNKIQKVNQTVLSASCFFPLLYATEIFSLETHIWV